MAIRIAIGGDHAGVGYKEQLHQRLLALGYAVQDFGPVTTESVDYVICGSGNGVAITANKHQGIRAALCWNEELAALARQHNDANVLALPARFISYELAERLAEIFLTTRFEGGRHQSRVSKIACT
jgi:ribose 5-phosphate isomerase B